MSDDRYQSGERLLLQVGAVGAIIGTVLQVAAGTSQSVLLGGAGGLASLAGLPDWVWPTVYLGFIVGAMLWVAALVSLASTLTEGPGWALARLALAAAFVGATLHAVDGSLNAGGLASLARAWTAASESERAVLEQEGEFLLRILEGTWAGVITLYHGIPFVVAGLAVALSRRYPAWLGWIGVVGGAGSVIVGVAMFLGLLGPEPAVPFAVAVSLFMVILGCLMWIRARSGSEPAKRP